LAHLFRFSIKFSSSSLLTRSLQRKAFLVFSSPRRRRRRTRSQEEEKEEEKEKEEEEEEDDDEEEEEEEEDKIENDPERKRTLFPILNSATHAPAPASSNRSSWTSHTRVCSQSSSFSFWVPL